MWLKINNRYHQDPTLIADGFMIRMDDIDGCRVIVRDIPSAARKMRACLGRFKIKGTFDGEHHHIRELIMFRGTLRLLLCVECTFIWKRISVECVGYELADGLSLDSSCSVTDKPSFGTVINIEFGTQAKQQ